MPRKKSLPIPGLDAARQTLLAGDFETAEQLLKLQGSLAAELARDLGMEDEAAELEQILQEEPPLEIPQRVHVTACKNLFVNREIVAEWSHEVVAAGFKKWGDYRVEEVPVVMRVFYMPPGGVVMINELAGTMRWQEIVISNEDGTIEIWSNVPQHDGMTPPWSRLVRDPDADFNILLDLLRTQSSNKPQLVLKKSDFRKHFCAEYERSMRWRAEGRVHER
jgi:hypothetical protein